MDTTIDIAVIRVAGLGTRLLSATKSQPKEMRPVGRKPVVQYVVEELTRVGMRYEPMDPALLPPLYVSHHETLGEPTEVFHDNIRERFNRGDQTVVGAMKRFAELAADGRDALIARDSGRLVRLIDRNFDTRRGIYHLPQCQVDMVETARRSGASAKFAGSGGAILSTYDGEEMFADVRDSLAATGSRTIKPQVAGVPAP
jgi:glucuronokinase